MRASLLAKTRQGERTAGVGSPVKKLPVASFERGRQNQKRSFCVPFREITILKRSPRKRTARNHDHRLTKPVVCSATISLGYRLGSKGSIENSPIAPHFLITLKYICQAMPEIQDLLRGSKDSFLLKATFLSFRFTFPACSSLLTGTQAKPA